MNSLLLRAWCLMVVMMATMATTEEVVPVEAPKVDAEVPLAVKAEEIATRDGDEVPLAVKAEEAATSDGAEVPSAVEAEKTATLENIPPGLAAENENTNREEDDGEQRSPDDGDDSEAKKFFFAYGSTTTAYGVSRFTRTVPYTCFTAVNQINCAGRRKKSSNRFRFTANIDTSNLDPTFQSAAASPLPHTLTDVEDGQNAKFFFTVWSTSTSLLTITSYSTDTRATVSVSAGCSIANFVYNGC